MFYHGLGELGNSFPRKKTTPHYPHAPLAPPSSQWRHKPSGGTRVSGGISGMATAALQICRCAVGWSSSDREGPGAFLAGKCGGQQLCLSCPASNPGSPWSDHLQRLLQGSKTKGVGWHLPYSAVQESYFHYLIQDATGTVYGTGTAQVHMSSLDSLHA